MANAYAHDLQAGDRVSVGDIGDVLITERVPVAEVIAAKFITITLAYPWNDAMIVRADVPELGEVRFAIPQDLRLTIVK